MLEMSPLLLEELPVVSNNDLPPSIDLLDEEILEKTRFLLSANSDFFAFLDLCSTTESPSPRIETILWEEQSAPLVHHCMQAQQLLLLRILLLSRDEANAEVAGQSLQQILLFNEFLAAIPDAQAQLQAAQATLIACKALDLIFQHLEPADHAQILDSAAASFSRIRLEPSIHKALAGAVTRAHIEFRSGFDTAWSYYMPHLPIEELHPLHRFWAKASGITARRTGELFSMARSIWEQTGPEELVPYRDVMNVLPGNAELAALGGPFLEEFASIQHLQRNALQAIAWRNIALIAISRLSTDTNIPDAQLLDPFSGNPMMIQERPGGMTAIYSVGPDLQDNGGQTIPLDNNRPDLLFLLRSSD
jgi:hypothetical protein